jgi:preprotein translocase subunit SecG
MGADRFFWRLKMGVLEYVLGGVLIAMALFLVIAVLAQTGKDKKLSGSIAGGSDTYFGKSKGRSWDKILARLTTVIAILFGVLVVVLYVLIAKN